MYQILQAECKSSQRENIESSSESERVQRFLPEESYTCGGRMSKFLYVSTLFYTFLYVSIEYV